MKYILPLLFFAFANISGQIRFSEAGVFAGGGNIFGRAPATFSFGGGVYLRAEKNDIKDVSVEAALLIARDADKFTPEDTRGRYYPFIKGAQLNIVVEQHINASLSLLGSGGLLILNDRTFGDVNEWGEGFAVSGGGRLYFDNSKINLTATASYGLTLNATTPGYSLFLISAGYRF